MRVNTISLMAKFRDKAGFRVPLVVYTLVALTVYLWVAWLFLAPEGLWSPDEGAKLLQMFNLRLEDHRLVYNIAYSGQNFDPGLRFAYPDLTYGLLSLNGGLLYFRRLPIFPLLVKPLFHFWGIYGLYLLPVIGGAAIAALSLKLYPPKKKYFKTWLLISFASPVFIYSVIFWEHTLATSFALFALLLAMQAGPLEQAARRPKKLSWILAGVLLGGSVYLRLENILFAISFLISYSIVYPHQKWGPGWAGIAMVLVLLPYLPLHWMMFQQGFPENARYLFYPFLYISRAGWHVIPDLLVGPYIGGEYDPGLLGDVWAFIGVVVIICGLVLRKSGVVQFIKQLGLGLSALIATYFLFTPDIYRSAHGLLFTTPWVLIGLSQAGEIWRQGNRKMKLFLLTCILGLAAYAIAALGLRATSPQGGLEWGARFVLSFYPLLAMITIWEPASRINSFKYNLILVIMIILGMGFQVRGVLILHHDKQINAEINRKLVESREKAVVTDLWWLPFNAAPIYYQKEFYISPSPDRIADWVEIGIEKKVSQFILVTLDPNLPDKLTQYVPQNVVGIAGIDRVENVLIYHVFIDPNQLLTDNPHFAR
jgi:hypothetical protein